MKARPQDKLTEWVRGSNVITLLLVLALSLALGGVPVLAVPGRALAEPSPTPRQDISWSTNGVVNAVVNAGDVTYIGGNFTSVGPNTGQGVPIDTTSAAPWASFPKINGRVNACVSDGSGGFYVGGSFTGVGGVARNNIAHILPNGTVDPTWDPNCNSTVNALAVSGSTIYVGGWFNYVNNSTVRNRIAAFDTTNGNATSWNPNCNNTVNAIAVSVSGSTIYAGGDFVTVNGSTTRNRLAAFNNTNGTVDSTWNPNCTDTVYALAVSGSTIYAGGYFTTVNGSTTRNRLAAFNNTNGTATSWDPNCGNIVRALVVSGSTIYAGGYFVTVNGSTTRNRLAAFNNTNGTVDSTWNPNCGSAVQALAVSGSTIYAGGYFTTVNGSTTRNRLAAFNNTNGTATSWNPNFNNTVNALAVSGSTIYAGGDFTGVGGAWVTRNNIAAFNNANGTTTSWNPNCNGTVNALAVSGSTIYAGGGFPTVNGATTRNNIAAFNNTNGTATSWDPNCSGTVNALAVSGSTIYAGGFFTTVNGSTTRNFAAAFNNTNGTATSWDPNCSSVVNALVVSGSTVYAGGYFITVNGSTTRNFAAAFNNTNGTTSSWDPNCNNPVNALAVSGSTIYAGGFFTNVNGGARNNIAAFNNTNGTATSWNPNCSGTVNALAVSGSTIYAGGGFPTVNGATTRNNIAAFNNTNGTATSWDPNCGNTVNALAVSGSTVYACGGFFGVGILSCPYFAVFQGPPIVTSITPDTGKKNATAHITNLAGTNFYGTPIVKLRKAGQSDIKATNVKLVSTTRVTCDFQLAGEALGPWDVVVTNPDSQTGSLNKGFSVNNPVPSIATLSPDSKTAGDAAFTLTVNGTNFMASSIVKWNGSNRTTTYVSSTRLTASIPASNVVEAGTAKVTVVNPAPGGGTSNAKTFIINAKPSASTWYLAEGSTNYGFDCYITIQNPNADKVTAEVTYMTGSGAVTAPDVSLPAGSQATVNPKDKLGNNDFSTKVVCKEGKTIAVDRTMSWTGPGAASPEAHSSIGVTSPAKIWYLPEGSSKWGFECYLLIQNPNAGIATCDVTYMIEGEGPKTVTKTVPASSRKTFNMKDDIGEADASIKVEGDIPVIPERAMYRNNRREGHDSIGTTSPATDFYLAEGTSAYGFTTYVLIQNPNTEATDVTVTYMTGEGPKPQEPFSMEPNSRKTIKVNEVLPNTDFSTAVHGTKPIIAERAMYWDNGTGEACHDSVGMASSHTSFYLPDGQTSEGRETFTLVQNPNSAPVTVEIFYLTPTGEGKVGFTDTISANSRKTYNMADKGISGRAAIMVVSKTASKKIMCERAMYWNGRGAGTDTIGGYAD